MLLSLVLSYIYISQGSVETHLWCGGMYNDHINANCLIWTKVKCHVFYWPTV